MSSLSDSDVFFDKDRLLSQHQSVLAIMQGILDNPLLTDFKWIDICCGKGQIIVNLDECFSKESISKIHYFGYDIENRFVKHTEKLAKSLGMKNVRVETGDIHNFANIYSSSDKYHFITLTNTIHEINPTLLANLFYECIIRLEDTGTLFIYDMEKLPDYELGAVLWTSMEMNEIIDAVMNSFGTERYSPKPGRWRHKTCYGWNIQMQRQYLGKTNEEIIAKRETMIENMTKKIIEIINRKYDTCKDLLGSLTSNTDEPKTKEEEDEKITRLHEFWALSRVKEELKI